MTMPAHAPAFTMPPTNPISVAVAFKTFLNVSPALEFHPIVTPSAKPLNDTENFNSLVLREHYLLVNK